MRATKTGRDDARTDGLTVPERALSALMARDYEEAPAPAGVSADLWAHDCAELREFDARFAVLYVRMHERFAELYQRAYGRRYERTIHADWLDLRAMVRDESKQQAPLLIGRAFAEPLLVGAGIDSIGFVRRWAHQLNREPVGGSRIERAYRVTLEAAILEHDGLLKAS